MNTWKWNTIEKYIKGYKIKLSQMLFDPENRIGHYHYYIENKSGDIVYSGYSIGGAPEKVRKSDLNNLFNIWFSDRY